MNRNELARLAHANAVEKGFYNNKPSVESLLMLVICEVAELVEADRRGQRARIDLFDEALSEEGYLGMVESFGEEEDLETWREGMLPIAFSEFVSDTVEDEMADIYIRLLDIAGWLEYDVDKHVASLNDTRRQITSRIKHESIPEQGLLLVQIISNSCDNDEDETAVSEGLMIVEELAKYLNIDLPLHVELKMKYEKSRERLHGKRY